MRRTHKFYRWLALLLLLLLLIPGCKSKSGLTQDDNYSITLISPKGQVQSFPVQLSWNSNMVVVQKFLMEATFTLSDLHTIKNTSANAKVSEVSELLSDKTVLIRAQFPESRVFNLTIDEEVHDLLLDSIEIEVDGSHPGRVILNDTLIFQGIPDTNLKPSFDEFLKMLRTTVPETYKSANTHPISEN